MDDADLMTIGRFARLSGVSVHALRHYDEAGLLIPSHVGATSGYRRYRRGQIGEARLIRALRWADLPVEGVRRLLAAASDDDIRDVLSRHLDVLQRRHSRLSAQIADVTRFLQTGLTTPVLQPGCRPVQIKIAVQDRLAAVGFYEALAGKRYRVTQRTADADYSSFAFGEYGRDDFFLLWLDGDAGHSDRPGRANLSFLVDDLDVVHARALAAGATELAAPHDTQGMPRNSAITDPSGNWIGLVQA